MTQAEMKSGKWIRLRTWVEGHEKWILLLVFGCYLLLIIAGSLRGAAHGQDFRFHLNSVRLAARDPLGWIFGSHPRPDPPLYHLLVAPILKIFGENGWLFPLGLFNAIFNFVALWLLYALARLTIRDAVLRVTFVIFITLLPVVVVSSTVLAADAAWSLPTIGFVLTVANLALRRISVWRGIIVMTLCAVAAISIKYVALALIPAGSLALLALFRWRVLQQNQLYIALFVFLASTATTACFWINQRQGNVTDNFSPAMGNHEQRGEMSLRSLLFFQLGDSFLLNAPVYGHLTWRKTDRSLFNANYFSYPGLVWYGTFSDYMIIYRRKPIGTVPKNPSTLSHFVSKIALVCSAPTFFMGVMTALIGGAYFLVELLKRPNATNVIIATSWLCGLGCFSFIMTALPFVTMSYAYAYWAPRLVVPGIWLLSFTSFAALDRLSDRFRHFIVFPVCFYLVGQSMICALPLIGF